MFGAARKSAKIFAASLVGDGFFLHADMSADYICSSA